MNTLTTQLDAKRQEYVGLNSKLQALAASPDLNDDGLAQMEDSKVKMHALAKDIERLQALESDVRTANMNAGAMAPAGMRFDASANIDPSLDATLKQAGAGSLLAFTPTQDKVHVYEQGGQRIAEYDGIVLPEKVWNAISEDNYERAFRAYIHAAGKVDRMSNIDRRVLEVGDDASGGFLVPVDYQRRIIERKPTPTRLRANVATMNTGSDTVILPRVVYDESDAHLWPNGMRLTWTGETPSSSTVHRVTQAVFGTMSIPIGTAMLSQALTLNMIEDSFSDILGWLVDRFGLAVELTEEKEVVEGTGLEGRMRGITLAPDTTGEPASVVSGSAASLTADGIINLAYALDEQYDDNAKFYFNKRSTGKTIATLKDADNRYLFASGSMDDKLATARPKELVGYPFSYVGFMPNLAANAYPIIHGDASGFMLVRRIGFSVKLLTETYYEQNQLVAVGRLRVGGRTVEPWKMNLQKCST